MKKALILAILILIPFAAAAQTPCTPGPGVTCTTNLQLWVPNFAYANWDVPLNNNWNLLDAASLDYAKLDTANTFTGNITAPTFIGNLTGNVAGTATGLSGTPNISITNLLAAGTITMTGIESLSGSSCLQIDTAGVVTNTAAPCSGAFSFPTAGIAVSTGAAWATSLTAPSSTIVGISDSQTLSNKSFGTGMVWPTFNQNTTGTAANITATSNSSLTTLSSLALPASQITGAFPSLAYTLETTSTNCASSASPAVCAAAPAGAVVVAASATTVVVDTTAVTADSEILLQEDSSLGTRLSVTCNATPATAPPTVSARTAGTSFTITTTAPTTDPRCFTYKILN